MHYISREDKLPVRNYSGHPILVLPKADEITQDFLLRKQTISHERLCTITFVYRTSGWSDQIH